MAASARGILVALRLEEAARSRLGPIPDVEAGNSHFYVTKEKRVELEIL